jgi:hypothetical protein
MANSAEYGKSSAMKADQGVVAAHQQDGLAMGTDFGCRHHPRVLFHLVN